MAAAAKLKTTKGDAVDILAEVNQDITGWNIRFEVWDNSSPINRVRKASSGVSGGSSTQAVITDAINGKFEIYIDSGDTTNFVGDVEMEIELEDTASPTSKKFTVFRGALELNTEQITWTAVGD